MGNTTKNVVAVLICLLLGPPAYAAGDEIGGFFQSVKAFFVSEPAPVVEPELDLPCDPEEALLEEDADAAAACAAQLPQTEPPAQQPRREIPGAVGTVANATF